MSTYGLQLYQTLTNGSYTYKIYQTASGSYSYNWTANSEYEILRVTVSGGIGNGIFEIANDQFIINDNGQWYIEHSVFGDITNSTTPLYHQNVSGVPLPVILNIPVIPKKFDVSQNYPNPFNPVTKIDYQIPTDGFVSLKLYDMLGREVKNVFSDNQKAGYYTVKLDGSTLASGMYFCIINLNSSGQSFTKNIKLMLIK